MGKTLPDSSVGLEQVIVTPPHSELSLVNSMRRVFVIRFPLWSLRTSMDKNEGKYQCKEFSVGSHIRPRLC